MDSNPIKLFCQDGKWVWELDNGEIITPLELLIRNDLEKLLNGQS